MKKKEPCLTSWFFPPSSALLMATRTMKRGVLKQNGKMLLVGRGFEFGNFLGATHHSSYINNGEEWTEQFKSVQLVVKS